MRAPKECVKCKCSLPDGLGGPRFSTKDGLFCADCYAERRRSDRPIGAMKNATDEDIKLLLNDDLVIDEDGNWK